MGEQAIKLLDGNGKVAIITSLGAANLQNRLEGVRDALAKAYQNHADAMKRLEAVAHAP